MDQVVSGLEMWLALHPSHLLFLLSNHRIRAQISNRRKCTAAAIGLPHKTLGILIKCVRWVMFQILNSFHKRTLTNTCPFSIILSNPFIIWLPLLVRNLLPLRHLLLLQLLLHSPLPPCHQGILLLLQRLQIHHLLQARGRSIFLDFLEEGGNFHLFAL